MVKRFFDIYIPTSRRYVQCEYIIIKGVGAKGRKSGPVPFAASYLYLILLLYLATEVYKLRSCTYKIIFTFVHVNIIIRVL